MMFRVFKVLKQRTATTETAKRSVLFIVPPNSLCFESEKVNYLELTFSSVALFDVRPVTKFLLTIFVFSPVRVRVCVC